MEGMEGKNHRIIEDGNMEDSFVYSIQDFASWWSSSQKDLWSTNSLALSTRNWKAFCVSSFFWQGVLSIFCP